MCQCLGGLVLLTTDNLSGSTYVITGISGVLDGHAITGLIAPGGPHGNDNVLNEAAPWLDGAGVAFSVATLGAELIDYDSFSAVYNSTFGGEGGSLSFVSMQDVVTTPEPASLGLLATALGFLGWTQRRKL